MAKLRNKFILSYVMIGFVAMVIFGILLTFVGQQIIQEEIISHLQTTTIDRANEINSYFFERRSDVFILSQNTKVIDAISERKTNDLFFKEYKDVAGYNDLYLIDSLGNIFYSVDKKSDFGTNLEQEDTNLAKLFQEVKKDLRYILSDYELSKSNGEPAFFIAAPVFKDANFIGVIALEINTNHINNILSDKSGLGESGETYLVGNDYFMRSNSLFIKENTILKQKVSTENSIDCFKRRSKMNAVVPETMIFPDYRGIHVLGTNIHLPETDWCLLAEIDEAEAFAPIYNLKIILLLIGLSITFFIVIFSFFFSNSITKPIIKLENVSREMEKGNFKARADVKTKDELGKLGESFNKTIITLGRLNEEQKKYNKELQKEKNETEIKAKKLKNAEKAVTNILEDVKKSEEKMKLFFKSFESSPNPKAVVKYIDKKPSITQVNDAFLKFYGFTKKEVIGQNPVVISSGKTGKEHYKKMWKSILNPKVGFIKEEIINKRKDGTLVYVLLTISTLFDNKGNVDVFVADHLDITKQKEAEKMKEDLISIVGHELKTPLTSIISMGQLVSEGKMGPVNNKQKEALGLTLKDAHRLHQLIENTLDVKRFESGRIQYNIITFNLLNTVTETIKTVEAMAKEKGITIEMVKQERVDVVADSQRIIQVIINFLTNAVKYGKDKGRIWVSVYKKGNNAIVSVKDEGRGIAKENLPKVFDKMYQTDISSKRISGGLGFGLYISKEIVEAMKGKVWAESKLEKGSIFYFSLPLKGKGLNNNKIKQVNKVKENDKKNTNS